MNFVPGHQAIALHQVPVNQQNQAHHQVPAPHQAPAHQTHQWKSTTITNIMIAIIITNTMMILVRNQAEVKGVPMLSSLLVSDQKYRSLHNSYWRKKMINGRVFE